MSLGLLVPPGPVLAAAGHVEDGAAHPSELVGPLLVLLGRGDGGWQHKPGAPHQAVEPAEADRQELPYGCLIHLIRMEVGEDGGGRARRGGAVPARRDEDADAVEALANDLADGAKAGLRWADV